jgi:predicted adenylyl cyclase CyaB
MAIEVEIRSFIDDEKFEKLLSFFKKNARFLKDDYQVTVYFSGNKDLRVQKNRFFSRLWLKKGKIHDEVREEIEVRFKREEFEKILEILSELGFKVEIVWLRKRKEFEWNGVKVYLDDTEGYGKIIEVETYVKNENEAEEKKDELISKLESLGVKISKREEFEKKFEWYKKNWKRLLYKRIVEVEPALASFL